MLVLALTGGAQYALVSIRSCAARRPLFHPFHQIAQRRNDPAGYRLRRLLVEALPGQGFIAAPLSPPTAVAESTAAWIASQLKVFFAEGLIPARED
ncbi:MAG: hypothetical protein WBL40_07880, partial [Terrimicrobiaceae bacterium]